jgi:class 3 adenylate cyclase
MLEGFFGRAKRLVRRAAGSGSTTNSVVHNLGPEFLVAFSRFEKQTAQPDYVGQLDVARFRAARAQLASAEAPASHRRSVVRNFERHLEDLRARWGLPVGPDTS